MTTTPQTSPRLVILAVLCGGGAGAVARVLTNAAIKSVVGSAFPVGILCINIVGSFIMGRLIGGIAHSGKPCTLLHALVGTGFLGGLTTFSSFAADTLALYSTGSFALALLNIILNIVLGIGAAGLGLALAKGRI